MPSALELSPTASALRVKLYDCPYKSTVHLMSTLI